MCMDTQHGLKAKYPPYIYRYMNYDDEPTFNDFKPFGGWNKPTMKQYTEDSKECVANLHLDYSDN